MNNKQLIKEIVRKLLNEITTWDYKVVKLGDTISFLPKLSYDASKSLDGFAVRLITSKNQNVIEFGNYNVTGADTDEIFSKSSSTKNKLQKIDFVKKIFHLCLDKVFKNELENLSFIIHNSDNYGATREKMYKSMFNSYLNHDSLIWNYDYDSNVTTISKK